MSGCKSIKKVKAIETSTQTEAVTETAEKMMMKSSVDQEKQTKIVFEEEEQTVTESYDVTITDNGKIVKTPTKTTTIVKRKYKEDSSSESSSDVKEQSLLNTKDRQSNSSDYNLDLEKESEGMNVIEDAADALFPTWGKILVSILTALAGVGWKIYQDKKGSN
jgi:archaellum component FlaF (FlaF/FlaG flagellin family)